MTLAWSTLRRRPRAFRGRRHDLVCKPDALVGHVRFDERGLETWPWEPDCGPARKRRNCHRTLPLARQSSTLLVSGFDEATLANRLYNAAEVTSTGGELEFDYAPTENLILGLSIAYQQNEFASFPNASCFPTQTPSKGCVPFVDKNGNPTATLVTDRSGYPVSNQPELRVIASGRYDYDIASMPFGLFFTGNYRWQDQGLNPSPFESDNPNIFIQDSYGILDASIGIQDDNGRYHVRVFAENLLDEFYVGATRSSGDEGNTHTLLSDYEQRVGVEVAFNFD